MPWIRSYVRSDGTPVRAHHRSAAGSGTGVLVFGVILLAAAGYHGHSPADAGRTGPVPARTVHYPVTFPPMRGQVRAAVPQPSVSYPIRFSETPRTAPRPRSTVSYPIRFSSSGSGR